MNKAQSIPWGANHWGPGTVPEHPVSVHKSGLRTFRTVQVLGRGIQKGSQTLPPGESEEGGIGVTLKDIDFSGMQAGKGATCQWMEQLE